MPGKASLPRAPLLAVLEGGFNFDFRQRHYETAAALNIKLVILDRQGHWIQHHHTELRQSFLPVDISLDAGLPARVAAAIESSGLQLDGITSFTDSYLVYTAQACELLGLPTSPSAAYARAVNKFETRRCLGRNEDAAYFESVAALHRQLPTLGGRLSFPSILKPSSGGGSQGVFKLDTQSELTEVVEKLASSDMSGPVLLEAYVDGPEVDVNFVLHDSEILFCEVTDNLPSTGEDRTRSKTGTFLETCAVWPSALDEAEQGMLKKSLHRDLLELGFTTGVFHVEARVRDSKHVYGRTEQGLVDLIPSAKSTGDPAVFLIEVNARAPGRECARGAHLAYGVDYYAVQMLLAVGDFERAKALSQPKERTLGKTDIYWCAAVYVPADRPGILATENVCRETLERRPDVAANVAESYPLIAKGSEIPAFETGILRWIATYMVVSKNSREEVLRVAQVLNKETKYEVEEVEQKR